MFRIVVHRRLAYRTINLCGLPQVRRLASSSTEDHWSKALSDFLKATPTSLGDKPARHTQPRQLHATNNEFEKCWQVAHELYLHPDINLRLDQATLQNQNILSSPDSDPHLILRYFDNSVPNDIESPHTNHSPSRQEMYLLNVLGEALYAQFKYGFPNTPQCWEQKIHGFFNYPAGMQPVCAALMTSVATLRFLDNKQKLITDYVAGEDCMTVNILDPCCGAGTTLVEVQRAQEDRKLVTNISRKESLMVHLPHKLSLCAHGFDLSPLAVLVSVGHTWRPTHEEINQLRQHSRTIFDAMALRKSDASDLSSSFVQDCDHILDLIKDVDCATIGVENQATKYGLRGPLYFCFMVAKHRCVRKGWKTTRRKMFGPKFKRRWGRTNKISEDDIGISFTSLFSAVVDEYTSHLLTTVTHEGIHSQSCEEERGGPSNAPCIAHVEMRNFMGEFIAGTSNSSSLTNRKISRKCFEKKIDCIVTSPAYPGVYDYLSFARHVRSHVDIKSSPDGRDWADHWSTVGELCSQRTFKRFKRDIRRALEQGVEQKTRPSNDCDNDYAMITAMEKELRIEWFKQHHAFLVALENTLVWNLIITSSTLSIIPLQVAIYCVFCSIFCEGTWRCCCNHDRKFRHKG